MNKDRWHILMNRMGFHSNETTYNALIKAYSEKHRHYHNLKHLNAVLMHLDSCLSISQNPTNVEVALWFHDAIYNPYSSSNETNSAQWAADFLTKNDADSKTINNITELILATLHTTKPSNQDQYLIIDIDLTILGSNEATYRQFEKDIRKEYKWIPSFIYRKKRKEVLTNFLNKDRIYHHEVFFNQFESQARKNINDAIFTLSY